MPGKTIPIKISIDYLDCEELEEVSSPISKFIRLL
jgi:hypothetical protein